MNRAQDPSPDAQASSVRLGRSPGRFARLRQTRVASLSPTPTLVGNGARSRSRSTQRGGPGLSGLSLTQSGEGSSHGGSRRMRSVSRARGSTSADARTLTDNNNHTDDNGKQTESSPPPANGDLEKGAPPQPQKKELAEKEINGKSKDAPKKPLVARVFPYPIAHFLGYRRPASELHPKHRGIKPYPSLVPYLHKIPLGIESIIWMYIGSFVGIAIVQLVFARPRHFTSSVDVPPHDWAAPIVVGSFGASSVLLYAAPNSPLSQPRCFVGGQTLSAVAGVSMTKLIKLAGPYYYDMQLTDTSHSIVWIAGSLATALALVFMTVTGTIHPPGGATAVLCATNMQVERMGWRIIPVVMLSSLLMVAWSLIFMNLGRKRYPESFFAAAPPGPDGGNYSQLVFDWIARKWKQRREGQKQDNSYDMQQMQGQEQQRPTNGNVWHDESPWIPKSLSDKRKSVSPPGANGQHPEVIDEAEEPSRAASTEEGDDGQTIGVYEDAEDGAERVERPSRWANAPARSDSALRGSAT